MRQHSRALAAGTPSPRSAAGRTLLIPKPEGPTGGRVRQRRSRGGYISAKTRFQSHITRYQPLVRSSRDQNGVPPSGCGVGQTHPGRGSAAWNVVDDRTTPSLPHVMALVRTDNAGDTFNPANADRTSYRNMDLSARIKAMSGKEDQGGGL